METIKLLESLKPSYMSLGLERLKEIIKIIPFEIQKNNVIVAGTNGKGSTCAFLSSILNKSNLRVGFYSSPHLIDLKERIRINGNPIDNDSLSYYTKNLWELLKISNKNLTFFEFLTILALWYFKEKETDLNVLEVGLGGRLDATNIAPSILNIITTISHDHTKILGKDLKSIAKEKAGIIKDETITITAPQKPKVLNILKEKAKESSSQLIELKKEVKIKGVELKKDGLFYNLSTKKGKYKIFSPLIGTHQIINSALAILSAEELSKIFEFPLTSEAVEGGISSIKWEGRFQKYNLNGKDIYLDGAHNINGIKAISKTLKSLNLKDINIGFSALKDKNPSKLLREIYPLSKKIFLFCLPSDRGMKYNDWEKIVKKMKISNFEIVDLDNFKETIINNEINFYTGSLFFIGEVLKCLKR